MTEADKDKRIQSAIEVIVKYGGIDGAHHRTSGQISDGLIEYPGLEIPKSVVHKGKTHNYTVLGESDEYTKLLAEACAGEDGPETYSWDVGIAP